ncbi:MAG: response regulator [Pseudohongiellaceae bacterium]
MSESGPIVHIVDEDREVRDSIKLLFEAHAIPVTVYPRAESFLQDYGRQARGCLLLDVSLPGMDGLQLQSELVAIDSLLPVIFLSGHADVPVAVRALKSGAYDFLQKPCNADTLLRVVREALNFNASKIEELRKRQSIEKRLRKLTPREVEVLNYITDGCPNKVIALELNLSQRTVESYRTNVMQKMRVYSLAHLVKLMADLPRDRDARWARR